MCWGKKCEYQLYLINGKSEITEKLLHLFTLDTTFTHLIYLQFFVRFELFAIEMIRVE